MTPTDPAPTSPPLRPSTLWSKTVFQRVFLFSLYSLVVYLFKLYEDFFALKTYYDSLDQNLTNFLISLLCIILPPLFYALYLLPEEIIRKRRPQLVELKVTGVNVTNGLLLIPWQIKSHLDKLYFAAQRVCSFRPERDDEAEGLSGLKHRAEVLEFFTDFYAGFLQIVLQLYIFALEVANPQVKSAFIIAALISSAMSVKSMLLAIRRTDDGRYTGLISTLGWAAMFASRVIVFALAATWYLSGLLAVGLVHVLGFTYAVWKLALKSHELADAGPDGDHRSPNATLLYVLTLLFFGLPSLLLWPFMFQLKRAPWPYVFLGVTSLENCLFISAWWFYRSTTTSLDSYALLVVISGTTLADLFLILYLCNKTESIDEVVQKVMAGSGSQSFGMYYEFCNMVFWLKGSKEEAAQRDNLLERINRGAAAIERANLNQPGTSSVSCPPGGGTSSVEGTAVN